MSFSGPDLLPPGTTLVQLVGGVIVSGTMVGGVLPTRGDGIQKTRGQRGKDIVGTAHCKKHCKYCTQHGKYFWRRLESAQGGGCHGEWEEGGEGSYY